MTAKLRIASLSGSVSPWEVTLTKPVSSIGRDPTCDVYLPDANRHLSRRHATLECRGGTVTLQINSKVNPVVLSGRELGFQELVEVGNGDVFTIADYQLTVAIEGEATTGHGGLSSNEDPFAWLNVPRPEARSMAPERDPLAELSTPKAPRYDPPDPFQRRASSDNRLVKDMEAGPFSSSAHAPGRSMPPDPMTLVTEPGGGPFLSGSASSALVSPSVDDLLRGLGNSPLHSPNADQLVNLAKSQSRGSAGSDHVHDIDLPFSPPPARVQPRISPAADDPFADLLGPLTPRTPSVGNIPPAPDATHALASEPVAAANSAPIARPSADIGDPLRPFFKGLGLDPASLPAEDVDEYMERAGQIMRAAIGGIVHLLVARGEMKKELRAADRTMLSAINNNPLKMMASEREAVGFLFDPNQSNAVAFMPPLEAISDACLDIMAHEFGLVAGLRAAVLGALKRYDPQLIEQQSEKQGKLASLLGNRKAQLWDGFVEWYSKTEETAADDIDGLFERDFLRAYMAQVKQIRAKN